MENYGVDPDVEVDITPGDWAAGRDPQIEEAVRLALAALEERPAATPPDSATRPSAPSALQPRPVVDICHLDHLRDVRLSGDIGDYLPKGREATIVHMTLRQRVDATGTKPPASTT